MPADGSAKPSEPPDPGDPNALAFPNHHVGLGFMKPSENCTAPFRHSSKKPRVGGIAGAANNASVSGANPNTLIPAAKAPYACAMPLAVPTAPPDGISRLRAYTCWSS